MPSHHLSASHTFAKMLNEMGLSLSTALTLLISGNHRSAHDACVAHISIDRTFCACPNSELCIYTLRTLIRPEWLYALNAP